MGRVIYPPLVGAGLDALQALVDVLYPPVAGHHGGYGRYLDHGQYGRDSPDLGPVDHVN
jgi:hypothetical protein